MRRIKLVEIKRIDGKQFQELEMDKDELPILEQRLDSNGKPVLATPRDENGVPFPGVSPEPVYNNKTRALKPDECLPMLLKKFYLNIPQTNLTRLDTINGTKMFQSIDAIKNGYIELDDDVHKWICRKLEEKVKTKDGQEVELGIFLYGVNLTIFENALDEYVRGKKPEETK